MTAAPMMKGFVIRKMCRQEDEEAVEVCAEYRWVQRMAPILI